jgi:hypothetical protein
MGERPSILSVPVGPERDSKTPSRAPTAADEEALASAEGRKRSNGSLRGHRGNQPP